MIVSTGGQTSRRGERYNETVKNGRLTQLKRKMSEMTTSTYVEEAAKVPWSITYQDGNANGFQFWRASNETRACFAYDPVQPTTSSSGVYSGGREWTGEVGEESALALWRWVRRLAFATLKRRVRRTA